MEPKRMARRRVKRTFQRASILVSEKRSPQKARSVFSCPQTPPQTIPMSPEPDSHNKGTNRLTFRSKGGKKNQPSTTACIYVLAMRDTAPDAPSLARGRPSPPCLTGDANHRDNQQGGLICRKQLLHRFVYECKYEIKRSPAREQLHSDRARHSRGRSKLRFFLFF